ncbi:hypothetical protein [Actinospica robiniae]|uniref:hypothetical protein n=1 Tax=Actinospica robiniae TaxID=304901 RepID=UPI000412B30F|nr:hypothetical protein [Actinospica robiniae]
MQTEAEAGQSPEFDGAALDAAIRACIDGRSGGEVEALGDAVQAAIDADPRCALHIADRAADYGEPIRGGLVRVRGLAKIVAAVSPIDRDSAGRVADVAEALIATFGGPRARATGQGLLVRALAEGHPDRAERLADLIGETRERASAFAALARQATADPARASALADRAEAAASSCVGAGGRAFAYCAILHDLAAMDRDRALRAADRAACAAAEIDSPDPKAKAKSQWLVTIWVANVDRDRAERLAAQITDEPYRRRALNTLSSKEI